MSESSIVLILLALMASMKHLSRQSHLFNINEEQKATIFFSILIETLNAVVCLVW